mmetsp:Transcript_51664/g.122982  ORF Transcript_51664/g.122982 Transcript_51664/m.122982 type:complete len:330 (+) Transcript_51664:86-1075(+)
MVTRSLQTQENLDRLRNEGRELRRQLKASQRSPLGSKAVARYPPAAPLERKASSSSQVHVGSKASRPGSPAGCQEQASIRRPHLLPKSTSSTAQGFPTSSRLSDASSTATPTSQASSRSHVATPAPSREGSARSAGGPLISNIGSADKREKSPGILPKDSPNYHSQPLQRCPSGASLASPTADLHGCRRACRSPGGGDRRKLLREAVQHGDVQTAKSLLQARGDDSCTGGTLAGLSDEYGWAPLHYAASGGHVELCEILLQARADVNATLPDFSTPLMLAVEEGKMRTARLLLDNGARTRCKDEAGFTVLERCAPGLSGLMALATEEQS